MTEHETRDISARKGEHIRLCLEEESQSIGTLFPSVKLPYCALPDVNLSDVSTKVTLLGKKISQPLIISSMTGGSEHGIKINTNLAIAVEATGVALAVGSGRIGLEDTGALSTFGLIRANAPSAIIFANMGAVQLNYGYTVDHYRRAVDMVQADALYLHLNPLQEAIEPGGDTNYAGLTGKIVKLIEALDVPVFIKEVGHGIDTNTARTLIAAGAAGIDVAGVGGTSYAWVESKRAGNSDFSDWFKEFGITTEAALRDISSIKEKSLLVASGGIRSPVEGFKAHILGADLYASTRPFLRAALDSSDAVIENIARWQSGLQISLFASGQAKW